MDNKQIEEAVKAIKEEISIREKDKTDGKHLGSTFFPRTEHLQTLLSLAQLFLSVKGAPKKKECPLIHKTLGVCLTCFGIKKYNQAIDEFTAWLAGRMKEIDEILGKYCHILYEADSFNHIHTVDFEGAIRAIKTMILEEK